LSQNIADYNDYASRYKNNDVVYLNIKTEISVDKSTKGLKIEVTKFEEAYYNSFKAAAFSEQNIQSSQSAKLNEIEAMILVPEDNKFRSLKVKDFKTRPVLDEEYFYNDLFSTTFVYPSLRQGAITRLKYTLDISEPYFFPYEIVKREYPVENFEFIINADKDVMFSTRYFFTDSAHIVQTKIEKDDRIIYTWKAKNIEAFRTEPSSPDQMCYLPQIVPYIVSYKLNNTDVAVFRNVDDLFHWKNKFVANIDHRHTEAMIQTVNSLTRDCTSDIEKVKSIYRWVQTNIKYIANEYALGGLIPRDPYIVFDKRYGDCKDMAVIIVEMLDIAGLKGYYTWLGTRNLPYTYEDIPTSIVSNHMIALYIEKGRFYYLDATDPYLSIMLPSQAIQGKEVMIRYGNDKYEIQKVPEVPADSNVRSDKLLLGIEKGLLKGKGGIQLEGYYFSNMKYNVDRISDASEKTKFVRSYLLTGNNKCVIDKYEIAEAGNKLRFDYEFTLSDYIVENDNEIYCNLNLSQPYRDFELLKSDRKLDYEFSCRSMLNKSYTFTIPQGYEVSYLPGNTGFEGGDFSYSITYEIKGNTVMYHFSFTLGTLLLKPSSFSLWNKMIIQMRSDFKEVVVLKNMK
jgi:hypothetical protein